MTDQPVEAHLADGTILQFPAGTSDEVVQRTVKNQVIRQQQAAKYPTKAEGGNPDLPWYAGYFNQTGDSSRTAGQVASDQAASVLKGIPQAVTGIPSTLSTAGSAVWNALKGNFKPLGEAASNAVAPVTTPVKQAVELAKPGLVNAPSPDAPETAQAAQGAGSVLGGAIIAGAAPHVMNAASNAWDAIKGKLPAAATPESVNRWMQVKPNDMVHGANPGQQILDEKLLGATKDATRANVKTALADAGQNIQAKLGQATQQGIKINAENTVMDSLANATKRLGLKTDKAFHAQLNNVLDDIVGEFPNLADLTPEEAHALKVRVGDSVKWTGAPYEADINQALVKIYQGINSDIKASVPGIADDMSRWGNLYQANKALKQGITNDLAGRGTGAAPPNRYSSVAKAAVKRALPYVAGGSVLYGLSKAGELP